MAMIRTILLGWLLSVALAHGDPMIVAFSNSVVIWTNDVPTGYYQIQWAASLSDSNAWQASWSNQAYFGGSTNRTITIDLPAYYRIGWDSNAWATDVDRSIGSNETEYAFPYSGRTTFENIDAGATYAIDWWSGSNWQRSWLLLGNIAATGLQHACTIPMQYRLRVLATNVPAPVAGMAWVFAGVFSQGQPSTTALARVSGYYIDTYEVSEGVWTSVRQWSETNGYSDLPDRSQYGSEYPVASVTWFDAVKWCNARSEQAGLPVVYYAGTNVYRSGTNDVTLISSAGYRLPSEAEWERAARGFLVSGYFPWGGSSAQDCSSAQANFSGSGDLSEYFVTQLTPCGGYRQVPTYFLDYPGTPNESGGTQWIIYTFTYEANGYGLYDMAGNVWEWCWDRYGYDAYPHSGTNYTGPAVGSRRVVRGGCYGNATEKLTVYHRAPARPQDPKASIGFRCVRSLP